MAKNKKKYSEKQRQGATLLSALANGSTDQARDIIKNRLGTDARDSKDLQLKGTINSIVSSFISKL